MSNTNPGEPVIEVRQLPGGATEADWHDAVTALIENHIALYVDDLDTAVDYLRTRGVRVLGDPTASKGHHEGQRWVYFLAPWGLQLELVSYPNGKAFDRQQQTGVRPS